MKKVNLLSKAEMKKVIGGLADVCKTYDGLELANCKYNVCLAGWDYSTHTEAENNNKQDTCYASAGY